MRVWLDVGVCGANPTGIPRATANLARALRQAIAPPTLDVRWVACGLDGMPRPLRSLPVPAPMTGISGGVLRLARSLPLPRTLRSVATRGLHWARSLGREAARGDDTEPPDILLLPHAGSAALPRPVIEALRGRGVAIAAICHDILPLTRPDLFSRRDAEAFGDALAWLAPRSDALIAVSRATALELRAWIEATGVAKPRIAVAGNVIDLPEPADSLWHRLGLSPEDPAFLLVGAIVPRKNHRVAIAAMERLWAEGLDAALVCLGPPHPLGDEILRIMRGHRECGRRLLLVHDASDAEVAEAYGKAIALLMPSEAEGYGMPVAEAAFVGCPVICSDLPVFREIAGEAAVFPPVGDVAAWAGAMARLHHARGSAGQRQSPSPDARRRWHQEPIRDLLAALEDAVADRKRSRP